MLHAIKHAVVIFVSVSVVAVTVIVAAVVIAAAGVAAASVVVIVVVYVALFPRDCATCCPNVPAHPLLATSLKAQHIIHSISSSTSCTRRLAQEMLSGPLSQPSLLRVYSVKFHPLYRPLWMPI